MDSLLEIKKNFAGKNVLIAGLGIQGGAHIATFFADIGATVRATDLKTPEQLGDVLTVFKQYPEIQLTLGAHRPHDVIWADIIIRNPGMRDNAPLLQEARELNKPILMEAALFMQYCPGTVIGITGTRGKSTTTHMIYEVLTKHSGKKVFLGGNIPHKPSLPLISQVQKNDLVVLELSSWQLAGFDTLLVSPHIAVLTTIYPDHLNAYSSMKQYIHDKLAIFRYQKETDKAVTTQKALEALHTTASIIGELSIVTPDQFPGKLNNLFGIHNYENAALALKVAQLCGIPTDQATATISNFKGLPFRIEYKGTIMHVPFYNDSTSTTPVACEKAIEAVVQKHPDKKLTLIVGGNSKNLPTQQLIKLINKHVATLHILKGTIVDELQPHLDSRLQQKVIYDNLPSLFHNLLPQLTGNEVVLFSPAATSFATFKNEFDRGQQFDHNFEIFQKQYGP